MTYSKATGTCYNAIPTLGYPSQKAAIVALHLEGRRPNEIKEAVGTSINSVHRALTEWRLAQRMAEYRKAQDRKLIANADGPAIIGTNREANRE